jgi:hypothetical protein
LAGLGKLGWTGLPTRLDRPGQRPQKVIWTPPLDSARRVDQDPYIKRPIRSPDERDTTSGRSGRRTGG